MEFPQARDGGEEAEVRVSRRMHAGVRPLCNLHDSTPARSNCDGYSISMPALSFSSP